MTKSNNEWVPEVGDEVEVYDNVNCRWNKVEITGVGIDVFIIRYYTNAESLLSKKALIRQIKTEAEKRRGEQLHQMQTDGFRGYGYSLASHTEVKICKNLLDAGWIKPKPLTNEDVEKLWRLSGAIQFCSHLTFKNICTHIHTVIIGSDEP